jgi:tyrosyl-tRNA synthetase
VKPVPGMDVDDQLALIGRGADQIEPEGGLQKKLERSVKTGKPLRIKFGIDPTGADVHLGHTVVLRKLRLFQQLGHRAVLIIGNATALVGDPSGRDQTRAHLTAETIEGNAKDYLKQVSRIVDIDEAEVHHNNDWFHRYGLKDMLALMSKITVQRMLERDNFTLRMKNAEPIYLHECLYPLMQGQDSVEIRADVELGGSEQLYNLMVGRDLQRDAGQEPQVCLTLPILRGLDGVQRMGKSRGNYVGVGESAYDQFAKTMSIADKLMHEWFELLTDRLPLEISRLTNADSTHPMEAKKALAGDIVAFYHGDDAVAAARAEWEKRFSGGEDPTEIQEVPIQSSELQDGKIGVVKLLVLLGLATSNKDARRLIDGGGVTIGPDKIKLTDPSAMIEVLTGLIVRKGGSKHVRRVRLV